jgi:hypothetical protein
LNVQKLVAAEIYWATGPVAVLCAQVYGASGLLRLLKLVSLLGQLSFILLNLFRLSDAPFRTATMA